MLANLFNGTTSIVAVPILAGRATAAETKADASGVPQFLRNAPAKLLYDNFGLPITAPRHDFIGQVLGNSMAHADLFDKSLILVRSSRLDAGMLRVKDCAVFDAASHDVATGWLKLRRITAVIGTEIYCDSADDSGETSNETLNIAALRGLVVGKIAPSELPARRPRRV